MAAVILDADWRQGYVPIPKCATNSLRATFPEWRATDDYEGGAHLFALIRDPVDRWFSGIAEATFHYDPDRDYDTMLDVARTEGRFVWDQHTQPQASFVNGYDVELVALDYAADYIQGRFGRRLRWERCRGWSPAPDLVPAIREFYAEDVALYEEARCVSILPPG